MNDDQILNCMFRIDSAARATIEKSSVDNNKSLKINSGEGVKKSAFPFLYLAKLANESLEKNYTKLAKASRSGSHDYRSKKNAENALIAGGLTVKWKCVNQNGKILGSRIISNTPVIKEVKPPGETLTSPKHS